MAESSSQDSEKLAPSSEVSKQQQQAYNFNEDEKPPPDLPKRKKKHVYRYDMDEMYKVRECEYSRTRPQFLSKEFDSEDGLFSPDKWLQHRWICEGVENRVVRRKPTAQNNGGGGGVAVVCPTTVNKVLNSIMEAAAANAANDLDQQILSPQRRAFASGCKAISPPVNDEDKQQQSNKSRWRQGVLTGSNGVDFKPAFQKSALEATSRSSRSGSSHNASSSGGSWTVVGGPSKQGGGEKASGNRKGTADRGRTTTERTRSSNTDEPMPEWLDGGPASVMDIIELKGFDDDPQTERKRRRSKSTKDPTSIGLKTLSGGGMGATKRDTSANQRNRQQQQQLHRQKRHSGDDISHNQAVKANNTSSRPSSRQTPQSVRSFCENEKGSSNTQNGSHSNSLVSLAPLQFTAIQVSELESSFLREQQQKQSAAKEGNKQQHQQFNLFSALGISSSQSEKAKLLSNNNNVIEGENKQINKLPDSDAELAAVVLGIPFEQLTRADPSGAPIGLELSKSRPPISQQTQQPSSSRLSRFFAKTSSTETKPSSSTSPISSKEFENAQKRAQFDMLTFQAQFEQARNRNSAGASPFQQFDHQNMRPPNAIGQHQQLPLPPPSMGSSNQFQRISPLQQQTFPSSEFPHRFFGSSADPPHVRPSSAGQLHQQQIPSPFAASQQFQSRVSPPQSLIPPQQPSGSNIPPEFQHYLHALARKISGGPNIQQEAMRTAFEMLMRDPQMRDLARTGGRNGGTGPIGSSSALSFIGGGGAAPPPPNPYQQHPPHFGGAFGQGAAGFMPSFPPPLPQHSMPSVPYGGSRQHPSSLHPLQMPHHPSFYPHGAGGGPMPPMQGPYHHQSQHVVAPQHFFPPSRHPPPMSQQFLPPSLVNNNNTAATSRPNQFNYQNTNLLNSPSFMPTSVMRQMNKVPGPSATSGVAEATSTSNQQNRIPVLQKIFEDQVMMRSLGPVSKQATAGTSRAILGCGPEEADSIITEKSI